MQTQSEKHRTCLNESSAKRLPQNDENEEYSVCNTRYKTSLITNGNLRSTSVNPTKKRDPCKDAGYDPSTIVPPVSCYSSDVLEENNPHFRNLKFILRNIGESKSTEEIA
ncbi:hypothetical protein DPMN_025890 [Dreissena polymorpha]|uniref:Uncharacterized protein n=1 Tax=Dreissena polymorpha TaxID=45954 RepID=A0A9D4LRJ0_DREPO|nr:hypothetical protein DPMN_025890 [Dreissena polymorpha]